MQPAGQRAGLRIDQPRAHRAPLIRAAGRRRRQALAHLLGQPARQLLQAGLDALPAFRLPGGGVGLMAGGAASSPAAAAAWRCSCFWTSFCACFSALASAVQPGADLRGRRAGGAEALRLLRAHQQQRQPVLARELAARATALEDRAAQVDLGLIGLRAAALAFAPGGLRVMAQQRPLRRGDQPARRLGGGLVGRKGPARPRGSAQSMVRSIGLPAPRVAEVPGSLRNELPRCA